MDAQLKIARCKTRLLLQQPFWGSLAMTIEFIEDNTASNPTMCTNGRWIRWNRKFVDEITEEETLGVIVHEICHKVWKHMLRRGNRNPKKWNYATDYTINQTVLEEGFKLPAGGLIDAQYKNMMAEKVYDLIEDPPEDPAWGLVVDDLTEDEKQELEVEIDQQIINAANAAKGVGKLPAFAKGLISDMEESQVDYRDKMRKHLIGDRADEVTFAKPERRMYQHARIIAPSVQHRGAGNWVFIVDTSGSVSDRELTYGLGEANAIATEVMPASMTVIYCSTHVNHVDRYEQGEEIVQFNYKDRGGTCCQPAFQYIRDNDIPCDQIIYFTDLEIFDWPDSIEWPLLWVSTGKAGEKAPIGETVRIIIKQ